MKWVVEQRVAGARLGRLCGLDGAALHTPLSLLTTRGGSAPHLTQEVLHQVVDRSAVLCVPAQHFYDHEKVLTSYKEGVAAFSALKGHGVCVTVQDVAKVTPSGYNDKKGVSSWSNCGRQIITPDRYMRLMEAMKPVWFEALNDADTGAGSSKKRVAKSLAASKQYLQQCMALHKESQGLAGAALFAPLLGGHSERDRAAWAQYLVKDVGQPQVGGYMLLGLHTNGPPAQDLQPSQIHNLVKASLEPLAEEGVRQAPGAWNPLTTLALVQLGVDIFDSSFPTLATDRSSALIFPCTLDRCIKEKEKMDAHELEHQNKRAKLSDRSSEEVAGDSTETVGKGGTTVQATQAQEEDAVTPYEVCLKDKKHMLDEGPLLEGCTCYACHNFSRAYVHHLLTVKELLGPVLLMIHNLHHWMCFFTNIREAVRTDQLDHLKKIVQSSV